MKHLIIVLALVLTVAGHSFAQDRVGFPAGYRDSFSVFYEFDRPEGFSSRVIYANATAASVNAQDLAEASILSGKPFPYGSVLVMEVYRSKRDGSGNVMLDARGRYVRDALFGIFVMRKERGFGADYGVARNGEWGYMQYRPDGSAASTQASTIACAKCHMEAGQGQDWVFGVHRYLTTLPLLTQPVTGPNVIQLVDYLASPTQLTVSAGTAVTFVNNDLFMHTVTARDGSFNRTLRRGDTWQFTFSTAGTYEFYSALHPGASGTIVVR